MLILTKILASATHKIEEFRNLSVFGIKKPTSPKGAPLKLLSLYSYIVLAINYDI